MREPSKDTFTKLILELITSADQMEAIMSRQDYKAYQNLIEILRFYRQFANND